MVDSSSQPGSIPIPLGIMTLGNIAAPSLQTPKMTLDFSASEADTVHVGLYQNRPGPTNWHYVTHWTHDPNSAPQQVVTFDAPSTLLGNYALAAFWVSPGGLVQGYDNAKKKYPDPGYGPYVSFKFLYREASSALKTLAEITYSPLPDVGDTGVDDA